MRAFTLIEAVIALALFALSAGGLMATFSNALLARENLARQDELLADTRAVRLQLLLEPDIEKAEEGGDLETYHSGEARWEAEIEPTGVVDLFRVQLNVEFSEPPEGLPPTFSETLFLLRPTWSQSDERSDLLEDKRQALEEWRGDQRF